MIFRCLFALLALAFAPCASAQPKPIYFLVDASGSMEGQNKADAELLLRALSLPRDQQVSITYFGKKPITPETNLCFETLDVPDPGPRGPNLALDLTDLGGKDDQTAITNAIDQVLSHVEGPAKLIVVTDGDERCNRHFLDIWGRHANAEVEIEVRQVGDAPNLELQKLEQGPPLEASAVPSPPQINLEFRNEAGSAEPNGWAAADWYERRLWVFAGVGLIVGAWFWGSSFGKRANFYEQGSKTLEEKRREVLKNPSEPGKQLDDLLPLELDEKDVKQQGRPDGWRSIFACAVAAALGVPLIFFEFAYPEWLRWTSSVVLALVLLGMLVFVIRKGLSDTIVVKVRDIATVARAMPITFSTGFVAIGFVIAACWIDLFKAQGAAWFVLSADFSAALAISASAPLLFVGSQWWRFEMAKSTYLHTYTEAISDTIREKRRTQKQLREDWSYFRSQNFAWKPEIEFTLIGRMTQFMVPKARRAREAVVERLRSIVLSAGGQEASEKGREALRELFEKRSVAERINYLINNETTQSQMEPRDEWEALVKALQGKDDGRIAAAYTRLASLLKVL